MTDDLERVGKLRDELHCLEHLYEQNRITKNALSKRIISIWKSFGVMATWASSWTNTHTMMTDLNNVGWRYAQYNNPTTSVHQHLCILKQKLVDDEDSMQHLKWYQFQKRWNRECQIIADEEDIRILSLLSTRCDENKLLEDLTKQINDIDAEMGTLRKRIYVLENLLRIECDKYLEATK